MAIASFCPRAQRSAQADLAFCLGFKVPPQPGEQQRARPQTLLHRSTLAMLCSRATPDPSELIFIHNVSSNFGGQVRKHGNLLLGTLPHKHASNDEIFQPLTAGRADQMGTKSRGLSSMWANAFKHLHSLAIKRPIR